MLLFTLTAAADVPAVEKLPEMAKFVNSLKGVVPHTVGVDNYEPIPRGRRLLDERAEQIFERIVENVFDSPSTVRLRTCAICGIKTSIENRVVYLEPSRIDEIYGSSDVSDPESLAAFIIAHQISMIIYDAYAEPHGYSINGNPIFYRDTYEGTWPIGHYVRKGNPLAHMEIDTYALLVMHEIGMKAPIDVITYLERYDVSLPQALNKVRDQRKQNLVKMIRAIWN